MADGPFQRLRQFLAELKRRKVYRVAAGYLVAAFVVLQLAGLASSAFGFPGWFEPMVWVVAALGFPIAVVLAWAFEVTPEGVRRTPATQTGEEDAAGAGERLSNGYEVLVGLGLVAAAVAGGWYLMGGGGSTISDRSVAVLPFETLGDTAATTFTDGLHTDLLTRLQRISELKVIARPSVMRYEDTEKGLSQVADELNARWIVTAAVQSSGNQVQVQPRLINPRTGTERWSASYRKELSADEIFALQEEITREVADALEAQLTSNERSRVQGRPTGDLDAYRLYVQGRQHFGRRTPLSMAGVPDNNVREAVRYFHRALEQDSSFALAWAGLADAAAFYPQTVPDSVIEPGVSQESAARRALSLDPNLAEAHASMGHLHLRNQNAPAALRELKRALELKPSYWEAHQWLGELYLKIGRSQEAVEHLELAIELNPQHPIARWRLYDAYLGNGQPKKSLREARRQQRLDLVPDDGGVGGEIRALYHLGRLEEARQLAEKHGHPLYLVAILAAQGDTARARKHFQRITRDIPLVWEGLLLNALGQRDQAFEAWEQLDAEDWGTVQEPAHLREGIMLDLSQLRDDPRYQELIQEANRAWGLNPDGSLPDSVDVSFGSASNE